jgi:acetyl esterase/lipase
MALIGKLATSVAIGAAIFGCLALGLVASERPIPDLRADGDGLNFDVLAGSDVASPNSAVPLQRYSARDGADLGFRRWESGREDLPLIVAVHGSGWHGQQFSTLGAALARQGLGDVIAPDLRGHGPNPERRGDVDYIGQFEDDLADLIAQQVRPGQRVVMLGHSSGGGLVIRFAGGAHGYNHSTQITDLLSGRNGSDRIGPFTGNAAFGHTDRMQDSIRRCNNQSLCFFS